MGLPSFIGNDLNEWMTKFNFSTFYKTRFSETDAFGHINNVSFFSYFEQARLDYFEHLNLFEDLNLITDDKPHDNLIVTANLECHYISQLYYGQKINIFVRTSKIGNSSFELEYYLIEQGNGNLAAIGRGSIVNINKLTGRSEPFPRHVKEKLIEYEKLTIST